MNFPAYHGSVSEELLQAAALRNSIINVMHRLDTEDLAHVLDFANSLYKPGMHGEPIKREVSIYES